MKVEVVVSFVFLLISYSSSQEQVSIDTTTSLLEIDPQFLGAGWEMWDYVGFINELNNTVFRRIVSELGPGILRVGGISCDFIRYVLPGNDLKSKRDTQQFWPTYEKDLTIDGFRTLVDFAKATNLELLFSLNELHGKNCHVNVSHCVGTWDTSNVQAFLTYLRDNKIGPILGFELGNELTYGKHITIEENIANYVALEKIFTEIWPSPATRPIIFGPSTEACNADFSTFIEGTKSFLNGFTYHSYPGESGSKLSSQLIDINWLKNDIIQSADSNSCIKAWKQLAQPAGLKLWLTETNSAWASVEGVMNGLENTFWYLASLGQYATTGVGRHCRWSLHGGDKGDTFPFVNTTTSTYSVLPDYWVAVLYKRIVGEKVLKVDGTFSQSLVYAHCGKTTGSVTVIFVNPSSSAVTLTLSGLKSEIPRDEYIFTAESLQSYTIQLNGKSLVLNSDGSLPNLSPQRITSGNIVLPKYSSGYIVFPEAGAKAC